jgi:AcrR family transcriptional regulator
MSLVKDEIVKKEIIDNAQKLFDRYGIKKTTMDEIAESCGKAKSTMYHYFKNKEEIFDKVITMEINNVRQIVEKKVMKAETIQAKLATYILEFHKEAVKRTNFFKILNNDPEFGKLIFKYSKKNLDYEIITSSIC